MEMKNSELNTSRNGRISPSAWWLYSDSEITNPAMNAPSASDSPTAADAQAVPSAKSITVSRKTSRCLVLTTTSSSQGTTYRAAITAPPTNSRAFAAANGTLPVKPSPPRYGVRRTIGTMHRSWKIRIASIPLPCGVSVSPPSLRVRSTSAVLLSDTTIPRNRATGHGCPNALASKATRPTVPAT